MFLDENLHKCEPLLAVLDNAGVRYERHETHFNAGDADAEWLPIVSRNQWIILTKDKEIRYNELEISAIITNKAREFFFRSGNWSGAEMAEILGKALPKMKRLVRRTEAPFIASITRSGEVHLRYNKSGSIYAQQKDSRKETGG
jgi:predicted nuclease of predicted toxin-antitoxin system